MTAGSSMGSFAGRAEAGRAAAVGAGLVRLPGAVLVTTVTEDPQVVRRTIRELTGALSIPPRAEENTVLIGPAGTSLAPLTAGADVRALLMPLPPESMAWLVLHRPVRAYQDAYGASLLVHAWNALAPAGLLAVPFGSGDAADGECTWTLPWLTERLGAPLRTDRRRRIAVFRRDTPRHAPASVLGFAMAQGFVLAWCMLAGAAASRPADALPAEDGVPGAGTHGVAAMLSAIAYSVTGAGYKAAGLRRFIRSYLPDRDAVDVVDLGGGGGFVGVELLLSEPRVRSVVNCDPAAASRIQSAHLMAWFQPRIEGRYRLVPIAAEAYRFDEPSDVVCAFASLLYVARNELGELLARAWESLRPGGILVVHENIRRRCFAGKEYYPRMFTAEELDRYLGVLGEVRRYRSSDFAPIDAADAGEATVFRVVQKASGRGPS